MSESLCYIGYCVNDDVCWTALVLELDHLWFAKLLQPSTCHKFWALLSWHLLPFFLCLLSPGPIRSLQHRRHKFAYSAVQTACQTQSRPANSCRPCHTGLSSGKKTSYFVRCPMFVLSPESTQLTRPLGFWPLKLYGLAAEDANIILQQTTIWYGPWRTWAAGIMVLLLCCHVCWSTYTPGDQQ